MPPLRLFIAIETPSEIRPQLSAIRDRLKETKVDVKWESDEKLHATLKFLGSTDEKLLPEIVLYTEDVCRAFPPLQVRYAGTGCFPNNRSPRIIWAGMEDLKGNLDTLQTAIEEAMVRLGFKKEERKFHPHVTLGRVKGQTNMRTLLRLMETVTLQSQPVIIPDIAIVKSELRPTGSVYTTLHLIPLGG